MTNDFITIYYYVQQVANFIVVTKEKQMKEIKLSKGYTTLIDDEDYELVSKSSWFAKIANKYRNTLYAARTISNSTQREFYSTLIGSPILGTQLTLHRLILKCGPNDMVDHIDGNGLNNQKSNLRVCTVQQNAQNRKRRTDNVAGYKGVLRNKHILPGSRCWQAKITDPKTKKQITVGNYYTKEDAAIAYNEMAIKLFGDYALLNDLSEYSIYNCAQL